ncbi:TRAP transporter large permease [Telmatospirillum sp. J64-1]|uniref:TRAP transporter large permease n=1 Tax=Telmatospirillum sp. J64-1 TaxID=2502183 RepID=UPI00115CB58D|nr:TRAP transporter large permease [Telmatospirillum sp. J64-1]
MIVAALTLLLSLGLGVPVAFAIGFSAVGYFLASGANLLVLPQQVAGQLSGLPLIAIPFFILTGELMNSGGITRRIFAFALAVVGRIPGSLGHANVIASMVFSGMSGAAVADVASLGKVELKAMRENNYPDDLSVGVTVTSSTIGPIIPPSINMVIFGSIAGTPIGLLFLGGMLPGILCGILLMATFAFLLPRRATQPLPVERVPLWQALKAASWALLTPIVLLGALFGGIATPTEASVLAALYATAVASLVYRELTLEKFIEALVTTAVMSGAVLLIIGFAAPLGYVVAREQLAHQLASTFISTFSDGMLLLIAVAILLIIIGTFLEVVAALILLTPVLAPALATAGIDPVFIGVFMVYGLGIGLVTPPVGICLYVGSQISGQPLEKVVIAILPFLVPLIFVLFLMIFMPGLITWLPSLVYGG